MRIRRRHRLLAQSRLQPWALTRGPQPRTQPGHVPRPSLPVSCRSLTELRHCDSSPEPQHCDYLAAPHSQPERHQRGLVTLSIPEGWLWTVRGKQGGRGSRLRARNSAVWQPTYGCRVRPGRVRRMIPPPNSSAKFNVFNSLRRPDVSGPTLRPTSTLYFMGTHRSVWPRVQGHPLPGLRGGRLAAYLLASHATTTLGVYYV